MIKRVLDEKTLELTNPGFTVGDEMGLLYIDSAKWIDGIKVVEAKGNIVTLDTPVKNIKTGEKRPHTDKESTQVYNMKRVNKDFKIKDCFFVAGIPGAGKSFFIQTLIFEEKISPTTMIYEGSIITDTIIDKIKLALKNKKKIHLIIINPTLNLAYENILNRQRKTGRGASLETMANIYSNLYNAVMRLYQIFGNELNIKIYSKTKNDEMKLYTQVHDINQLKTESYEEVLKKLKEIRKKA